MRTADIRTLLRESAPIAAIFLFWSLLGKALPLAMATTGAVACGVLMALLYAGVTAPPLARSISVARPTDAAAAFEANLVVAGSAGIWFLLAFLVRLFLTAFGDAQPLVAVASISSVLIDIVTFSFVATGVLTAVLYAVAVAAAGFELRARTTGSFPGRVTRSQPLLRRRFRPTANALSVGYSVRHE